MRNRGFLVYLAVLIAWSSGEGLSLSAASPRAASDRWVSLRDGLAKVREQYLPAIILLDFEVPAGDPGESTDRGGIVDMASWPSRALETSALARTLKAFVLIRLRPGELEAPYPLPPGPLQAPAPPAVPPDGGPGRLAGPGPTVAEVLGLKKARPAVVVLDFRERIVRLFDLPPAAKRRGGTEAEKARRLPRPSRLKKGLRLIAKVNALFVREARRVEPLLEKARYSHAAGDSRAAVSIVRELEPPKAQKRMDPVLKDRLATFLIELREAAEQSLARAEALDRQRQHFQAIDAFDKTAFDFPFKDVQVRASRRSGQILRKLTFGK